MHKFVKRKVVHLLCLLFFPPFFPQYSIQLYKYTYTKKYTSTRKQLLSREKEKKKKMAMAMRKWRRVWFKNWRKGKGESRKGKRER